MIEKANNEAEFSFHHIGIAVNDIKESVLFYSKMGYEYTEPVLDPEQDVFVSVLTSLKHGMPRIELLAPASDKSPILSTLRKSGGSTPYHICYQAENLDEALRDLKSQKFIVVKKPAMSNVFGKRVCFLYNKEIGLIEVIEK